MRAWGALRARAQPERIRPPAAGPLGRLVAVLVVLRGIARVRSRHRRLLSPARVSARPSVARRRADYNDELTQMVTMDVEKSKYLGGDVEHTHLVKGLDFALLSKVV